MNSRVIHKLAAIKLEVERLRVEMVNNINTYGDGAEPTRFIVIQVFNEETGAVIVAGKDRQSYCLFICDESMKTWGVVGKIISAVDMSGFIKWPPFVLNDIALGPCGPIKKKGIEQWIQAQQNQPASAT